MGPSISSYAEDHSDSDAHASAGADEVFPSVHLKIPRTVHYADGVRRDSFEQQRQLTIDDIERVKLIGVGNFAKVFLVRIKEARAMYAMKEIKKADLTQVKDLEHIRVERTILSQIDHPFLVRMHHWFHNVDTIFYVLDYVPGGELYAHMKRQRFSTGQVRLYAAEITLALEYLHRRGVVYRDLKPENILLTASGHIKLTDFGLSKVADPDATSCGNTFCGTPGYMAPEVVKGEAHGCSVDWWALGVLIYELIVGVPPFFSRDRGKMFRKIVKNRIRFSAAMPQAARDLVSQLMAKDPHVRLGAGPRGAEHVKAHAFFRGLDWTKVLRRSYRPEYIPECDPIGLLSGVCTRRNSSVSLEPPPGSPPISPGACSRATTPEYVCVTPPRTVRATPVCTPRRSEVSTHSSSHSRQFSREYGSVLREEDSSSNQLALPTEFFAPPRTAPNSPGGTGSTSAGADGDGAPESSDLSGFASDALDRDDEELFKEFAGPGVDGADGADAPACADDADGLGVQAFAAYAFLAPGSASSSSEHSVHVAPSSSEPLSDFSEDLSAYDAGVSVVSAASSSSGARAAGALGGHDSADDI